MYLKLKITIIWDIKKHDNKDVYSENSRNGYSEKVLKTSRKYRVKGALKQKRRI